MFRASLWLLSLLAPVVSLAQFNENSSDKISSGFANPNWIVPGSSLEGLMSDFFSFKSDPELLSPKPVVKIITENRTELAPGYIFLAPYGNWSGDIGFGFGPHIYDNDGDLIWNGQEQVNFWWGEKRSRAMNLATCDFNLWEGQHLCWSDITVEDDVIVSTNRVFRESYEQVAGDFGSINDFHKPNEHEFHTIREGTSFLQLIYDPKVVDLTPYYGPRHGYINDCCFQEVDILTSEEIFRWCAYETLGLNDALLYLTVPENTVNKTGKIIGNGSFAEPWDFCHMNSVDLTAENDYIVSVRHYDQIVQLAGLHRENPGEVMWRLGGMSSDFVVEDAANFTRQHDVSSVRLYPNGSDIILFDNSFQDAYGSQGNWSAAKLINVNNVTKEATLIQSYEHPDRILSRSQGSAQVLENGNVMVGWGRAPQYTEFSADGRVLMHSELGPDNPYSYRAHKSVWRGYPTWSPKLLAYRQSCAPGESLNTYVSWNGATEVSEWRFSVSNSTKRFKKVQRVKRTGFETETVLDLEDMAAYVKAEALDVHNKVLGSVVQKVFVPSPDMSMNCDDKSCFSPENYPHPQNASMVHTCKFTHPHDMGLWLKAFAVLALVFGIVFLKRRYKISGSRGFIKLQQMESARLGAYEPIPQGDDKIV